jgi:hypothetical protein
MLKRESERIEITGMLHLSAGGGSFSRKGFRSLYPGGGDREDESRDVSLEEARVDPGPALR